MKELLTIRKWNYGEYEREGYGAHCIAIDVGKVTFYFSYDTIVAYLTPGEGLVMRENEWGPTTGKHLNWISTTRDRLPEEEFEQKLGALLDQMNLALVSV